MKLVGYSKKMKGIVKKQKKATARKTTKRTPAKPLFH